MDTLKKFYKLQQDLADIGSAGALLAWDQEVYLPQKGAEQRAHSQAFLATLSHKTLVADQTGKIITELKSQELSEKDAALLAEVEYQYAQAKKVPEDFVGEMSRTSSLAYHAWVDARKQKNFSLYAPHLKKVVELHRKLADYLGYQEHPYDALLNQHERGMKTSDVERLFDDAKPKMQQLLKRIQGSHEKMDTSFRSRHYPSEKQHVFSMTVLKAMGYDFDGGRVDKTVHPFMIGVGHGDVRVTYRTKENDLFEELTTILHEGGHALYEQGLDDQYARTFLHNACSTAIHESQSRTWENIVGRSEHFWQQFFPLLRQEFAEELKDVSMHDVLMALNEVKPSFIRIESDELTYNFHIFLRFEIEKSLIDGSLSVKDIPNVWNARMQKYLGVVPPDDAVGCLQDVHWAHGIGYFSTYTLGNFYAAQFMHKAESDLPHLWSEIAAGNLSVLRDWQRINIHRKNNLYNPLELCKVVTGEELSAEYFVQYLEKKFKKMYDL